MECCSCSKEMEDVGIRQPKGGTEFLGGGDYGSTVTDVPCIRYAIYICDRCLLNLIKDGYVKMIDICNGGKEVDET